MSTGSPAEPRGDMPDPAMSRRFVRYPIELPLLYRIQGMAPRRVGAGWTRNLSEGGAGVELGDRLSPGTPLIVRFQTDQGPLEFTAAVVWVGSPNQAGSGVPHGLAFTEGDPKARQALQDLLLPLSMAPHGGLRLPIEIPAACLPKNPPGPLVQGRTGNISREGLLLLLPEAMPKGTVLAVTFQSPQGPLGVEGVVVWVDPPDRRAPGGPVRHGVHLTSLGWSTAVALGLLLAKLG